MEEDTYVTVTTNGSLITITNFTRGINKKRLCLLIDRSGSMGGLRISLVIHAIKMIISSSDETIEVAIFVFDSTCTQLTEFTQMNESNKIIFLTIVGNINVTGSTNLIDGLSKSLEYISREKSGIETHLLIFTDGEPDNKDYTIYQRLLEHYFTDGVKPCIIDVFGFGNYLSKNILQYIYQKGNGAFRFISDKNMLATIFVNYMANFRATNISDITLTCEITNSDDSVEIKTLTIDSMQAGQEKVFFVSEYGITINYASLSFTNMVNGTRYTKQFDGIAKQNDKFDSERINYHMLRSDMVKAIKERNMATLQHLHTAYSNILFCLEDCSFKDDICILLEDMISTDANKGQIMKAFQNIGSWGDYYLMTIEQAHAGQEITNFKDESLAKYGSSMANSFVTDLSAMFDSISFVDKSDSYGGYSYAYGGGGGSTTLVSASSFNDRYAGCFTGECRVETDRGIKKLCELKIGDVISDSNSVITHILISSAPKELYQNDKLCGTGNHPVLDENGKWIYFKDMPGTNKVHNFIMNEKVYSFACKEIYGNNYVDNIIIEGVSCATMGHGHCDNDIDDVISCSFWGKTIITIIDRFSSNGVLNMSDGYHFIRDSKTGYCIGIGLC